MATRQTQSRQSYGGSLLALESSGSGGGGAIPWTGGRWFTAGASTSMGTQGAYNSSTSMCLLPIYVPNACTINQISLGGTSSISVRAALYNDGGSAVTSLGPTTMIGTQFSGATTGSSTIPTVFTVTGWVIPAAGIYWFALGASSSTNLNTVGYQVPYSAVAPGATVSPYRVCATYAYNATWPATLATTTTAVPTGTTPTTFNFPLVGFNAS